MRRPRIRIDEALGELPLLELAGALDLDEIFVTEPGEGPRQGLLEETGGALFVLHGRTLIVVVDSQLVEHFGTTVADTWAHGLVCALLAAGGRRPDSCAYETRQDMARSLLAVAPTTLDEAVKLITRQTGTAQPIGDDAREGERGGA